MFFFKKKVKSEIEVMTENTIKGLLETITQIQRNDPDGAHSLSVAVYNLNHLLKS